MESTSFLLNRKLTFAAAALMVATVLTVLIDFYKARWQQHSFYLSESALFSVFWLLFIPGFILQRKIAHRSPLRVLLLPLCLSLLHLLAYPALVWLLSFSFYPNTFRYSQTFNYAITEYSLQTVFIYASPLLFKRIVEHSYKVKKPDAPAPDYIRSLLLRDAYNRKISFPVAEVLYFSANPPYINLHLPGKKYLYPGTLKLMAEKLPPGQFLRVHKSYLVNLTSVVSYQSRSNGDYNLTLSDGTELRLSRNYADLFKSAYQKLHQVTVK